MNENKRIDYLDMAKGISMIAIIAGHLGNGAINQVVFTFHVPIFFLISGYFMKPEDDIPFIKKKAKQLMLPYVIACAFVILGAAIVSVITNRGISQVVSKMKYWFLAAVYGSGTIEYNGSFHIGIIGALWFLPALFFSLILVQYLIKQQYNLLLIIICSYVGYKTTNMFWLPLSIQAGAFASIFVYCGYQMKKMNLLEKQSSILLTGGAVLWLVSILHFAGFYVVRNYSANGFLDILGALAGSYVVIVLCKKMETMLPNLSKILIFWGRNSLVLLCVHAFDLDVISWSRIYSLLTEKLHLGTVGLLSIIILLKLIFYTCAIWVVGRVKVVVLKAYENIHTKVLTYIQPEKEMDGRIKYWDIAKGIAIIAVILGDTDCPSYLRMIIFSFHMPFFFIANGFFIKNYEIGTTLKKSARSLLIPYITVCLISAVIYPFTTDQTNFTTDFFVKIKAMIGGMSKISTHFTSFGSVWLVWFVCCLFIARNLYVIIMRIFSRKSTVITTCIILLVAVGGYVIGYYYAYMPWSLDVAMVAIVFIAVGNWMRKAEFFKQSWLFMFVIPMCVWIYFLKTSTYIELATRSYPLGFLSLVEAVAGSMVCISVGRILEHNRFWTKVFSWLGENSMVILAVHCLEMMYFNWEKYIYSHLPISLNWFRIFFIKTVIIVFVSYMIVICREKAKGWTTGLARK